MRTLIDFTDEASPNADPLPDPSSICLDGDDVVLQLREVEVRMTFPQFLALNEALAHWNFRGMYGEKDLNDPDHCPDREHYQLRKIVGEMVNEGCLGAVGVGDDLRNAMRHALSENCITFVKWRWQEDVIQTLNEEIEELRAKLGRKQARAAVKTKETA